MFSMVSNWIALGSLVIAAASLCVSWYMAYMNSITLEVDIEDHAQWILSILCEDGRSIFHGDGLLQTNIKIVNSSNTDISFFDLRVIDYSINEELNYYNKSQVHRFNDLEGANPICSFTAEEELAALNLPEGNYGILKARSMTSFDIVVTPETKASELFVVFKVAKKKRPFKKIKLGYINSPYESYSGTYKINWLDKPDYKKIEQEALSEDQ